MIKEIIITVIAVLFIVTGLIFFLGAAIGLLRFPDFYTRMHAAGKGDTLSQPANRPGIRNLSTE